MSEGEEPGAGDGHDEVVDRARTQGSALSAQHAALPLVWLSEVAATDGALVGPKAARLAAAVQVGFPVPPAFVVTTAAFTSGMTVALEEQIRAAVIQLREQWPGDSPPLVAARSSASAEDLAGASFAGLQRTVLGLNSEEAVAGAVEEVWASLFSVEAEAYRGRVADSGTRAMAVLVQLQVPARVAGVAFSHDPLSGEAVTTIEAVAGLGEALVGGQAEPATWRVLEGQIVTRPDPKRAGDSASVPLLPDHVLYEVAELVERASGFFQGPQDVEWAWDGKRLWLLQARPITTRLEDFFSDHPPGDDFLWTAAFLNERFAQPVSPLGWTLVAEPLAGLAFGEPLRLLAAADFDGEPLLKLWRGHPYSRAAAWQRLYKLFPDWLLPEDAVRYFPLGDTTLRHAPQLPKWGVHLVANGLGVLRREGRAALPWSNPGAWRRYEGEHAATLAALRASAAHLADMQAGEREAAARQLLRAAQDLAGRLLTLHRWSLLWADLLYSLLRRLLRAASDETTGTQRVAQLTAATGSHTARLNQATAALAERARTRPEVRAALAQASDLDGLCDMLGPSDPFARAVRAFLGAYGHRFLSLDLYDPPFDVAPRALFDLLLAMVGGGERGSERADGRGSGGAEERRNGGAGERRGLVVVERLLGRFGFLGLTRRFLRLREDQRFRWQELLAFQRRVVLHLGELWVEQGYLAVPEHVFGLTWAELLEGKADVELGKRAAGRYLRLQALRREAALVPGWHYPDFLRGNRPLRLTQAGAALVGRAVSPGVARGEACLVASPGDFARVRPGVILVTSSPDPGWTPLFETVSGLVTERGGQLSHGAVVAREYALPAVFGVADAMRLIRDGEELLVDGTQGIVVRLEGVGET